MNYNKYLNLADRVITVGVDIQNDFCPGGALGVDGGNDVVDPMNEVTAYTRSIGGTVVLTRDFHPPTTPHFDNWPVHCVAGTDGAEFHPRLHIEPTDIIISKGTGQEDGFSGFEGRADDGTTLDGLLTPRFANERIVIAIGGIATDYCVLQTVLDAAKKSQQLHDAREGVLDVFTFLDAMKAVNLQPDDGNYALAQMHEAGAQMLMTKQFTIGEYYE